MKNRHTESEKVAIVNEAILGNQPIAQVCRRHGISRQTFYSWRLRYAGLARYAPDTLAQRLAADSARLRAMESENAELRRLLAEHVALIRSLVAAPGVGTYRPPAR